MSTPNACPRCSSSDTQRNKLTHTGDAAHTVHGVNHLRHKHPTMAVLAGALWGISKIADQFSETYRCGNCGHKWS